MPYRYVFSELPYATVLSPAYEKSHCSSCMSDVSKIDGERIECECDQVVYCSTKCVENDRPMHRAECEAFRRHGGGGDDDRVKDQYMRLIGRIVARYRLDSGVASLSTDFPSSLLEDRKFDDLMTHKREMRRSQEHCQIFERANKRFCEFFEGTDLASTPKWMVEKFYWRQCINSFGLAVETLEGSSIYRVCIGIGLYLNASRFDHSCMPNARYRFDGSRIVIHYLVDDEDDGGDQVGHNEPIQLSKKQWKNLRIDYGSSSCAYILPTTYERRRSLQNRYFFKCRCPICSNDRWNRMQMDSSPIECGKCQLPFVWKRGQLFGGIKLAKHCDCVSNFGRVKDDQVAVFGKEAGKELKSLLKMWDRIVVLPKTKRQQREMNKDITEFLKMFQALKDGSVKYWHPSVNLRRGQLNELCFKLHKFSHVVDKFETDRRIRIFTGTDGDLDDMIQCAETYMHIYMHYLRGDCSETMEQAAVEMIEMYKTRLHHDDLAQPGDQDRKKFWIKYVMYSRGTQPERMEIEELETMYRGIEEKADVWIMKNRRGAVEVEDGKK